MGFWALTKRHAQNSFTKDGLFMRNLFSPMRQSMRQSGQWSTILLTLFFLLGCASKPTSEFKEMSAEQKKAELYYDYGTTALVKQDYTKALTNLRKAIELDDKDSRFHNNLGMAYYFKKDSKNAITHLKRSLELDPKNSDARNNLASIYFYLGNLDEAQKLYTQVTKDLEYAKQFRVYYNLGLLSLRKNRRNQAINLLEKAIKENKSYCPAHFQLGALAFEDHNYHQASNYYENASLGNCADNPLPYYRQAEALIQLGEYGKALVKLEEVSEKFPKSKEAILAARKIKTIKVEKLRDNQDQALKYQLNQIERKLQKERNKKKSEEPAESLKF